MQLTFDTDDEDFDSDAVLENSEVSIRLECTFEALATEDDVYTIEELRRMFTVTEHELFPHGEFYTK